MWRFLKKTPLDRIGSALYQLENRYRVEITVILLKPISIYIFLLERKGARQASGAGFCAAITLSRPELEDKQRPPMVRPKPSAQPCGLRRRPRSTPYFQRFALRISLRLGRGTF